MIYRLFLLFLLTTFTFTSCSDCNCCLVDCAPAVFFDIKIDDQLTGNSLLIESDSLYHIDQMSIVTIIDGQATEGQLYRNSTGTNDSLPIKCWSNVAPDMMLLKLNQNDTDTLSFVSEMMEGECCDGYKLVSVSINGANHVPVLNSTITLLK